MALMPHLSQKWLGKPQSLGRLQNQTVKVAALLILGGGGNAKAKDGSRKRVWRGTPPKLATVPEEPAVATDPKVEEEEEDEDEDMGVKKEPAEAEKEKKKKKKKRRKSKKSKKDKSDSEDPGDGPDGPPGGPGGASDGSRGPGLGPALVAAT